MRADLHLHSIFSDGVMPVMKLAKQCSDNGLEAVSLTDHDTVLGTNLFNETARALGLIAVNGIEFTAFLDEEVHILGYGFDIKDSALTAAINDLHAQRIIRAEKVLKLLAGYNIRIPISEVLDRAKGVVGRAHIARCMIERNIVNSVSDALRIYLGEGKPCYVRLQTFTPAHAVSIIKNAGGKAVLAHPGRLRNKDSLEQLVATLTEAGLFGIELHHPDHSARTKETVLALADKHGLVTTGGSDFHETDNRFFADISADTIALL